MTLNHRRRLQICRLLTYGLPFTLILAGGIGWLWRVHYCNPCNSFPELCRPSGGEVRQGTEVRREP